MTLQTPQLFPIIAGAGIPEDWFGGKIPLNIIAGENSMIDSTFCFKQYFSQLPLGLKIGNHVTIWRASLAAEENGVIEIGNYSYLSNCSIVCSERITIGERVMIAGGVTIADSDFHPLNPADRLTDTLALSPTGNRKNRPAIKTAPVSIGNDVWIGFNATILKGVQIGDGAYISPGAVVLNHVSANVCVAGNPAKEINYPV